MQKKDYVVVMGPPVNVRKERAQTGDENSMRESVEHRLNSWEITKRNACINGLKILLILVQTLITALLCHADPGTISWQTGGAAVLYVVLLVFMCCMYDVFQIGTMSMRDLMGSLVLAQAFALFFQYGIISLLLRELADPVPFLAALAVNGVISTLWARLAIQLYQKLFPAKRTYVICDDSEVRQEKHNIGELSWKFQIVDFLDIQLGLEEIFRRIADAEAVVLVNIHSSERNQILKRCITVGVQVYSRPKIGDLLMWGGSQMNLLNVPIVHCGRYRKKLTYVAAKRAMDILLSGVALVVLSPIMAVVAVAVHLYDGGPAFYRQVRLTQDGREFKILKFRSMRMDAEKDGVARLASENDSRITPVGRVIRAVRLDELPQLLNILKGEMSIVGPRPERPELAEQYEEDLPEFRLRLQTKAGLTGYAQVYGKYNTPPYEKLQMDLLYIAKQSLMMDIKLIFMTVRVLFMKESTEGVGQEEINAIR